MLAVIFRPADSTFVAGNQVVPLVAAKGNRQEKSPQDWKMSEFEESRGVSSCFERKTWQTLLNSLGPLEVDLPCRGGSPLARSLQNRCCDFVPTLRWPPKNRRWKSESSRVHEKNHLGCLQKITAARASHWWQREKTSTLRALNAASQAESVYAVGTYHGVYIYNRIYY